MEFNLSPESPVLYYGPKAHTRFSSRRYILWPAWAYRVIAPFVKHRKINVLQKAVMGLLLAGVHQADSIAENLAIHKDLVQFIFSELMNLGFMNSKGELTDKGKQALDEDELTTEDMIAGYVFQDPWKEDLWPRFVSDLEYTEVELNEEGYPFLVLGTKGNPKKRQAFSVIPRNQFIPTVPTAKSVVEAVNRHKRSLRFKNFDEDILKEETESSVVDNVMDFNRVSFIEEKPQPVLLVTYLYVPESGSGALDWYACDPFGLGQSVMLRRKIEEILPEIPGLIENINRIAGETLHAGFDEQKAWIQKVRLKAEIEVERKLSVRIRSHTCFDHLVEMESVHIEVQTLGEDSPRHKINDLLRSGVKVLESIFSEMTKSNPLRDIWKRVYVKHIVRSTGKEKLIQQKDSGITSAIYEGAIRAVGFDGDIPGSFLNIKPGQIRAVADYGDTWRLRPLVTATVLLAQQDTSHPLYEAVKRDPFILVSINDIANVGGGAGHANSDEISLVDAESHVNIVYSAVSTLLGLSAMEDQGSNEILGENNV